MSRCNKWRLNPPEEDNVKRWVESRLQQSIFLESVRLNNGAPLATLAFIESGLDIRYGHLVKAFTEFVQPPHIGIYDVAAMCTADGIVTLQLLSYFLVDCLKWQQGATQYLVHQESLPAVEAVATTIPTALLLEQVRNLNNLHRQLAKHTGLNIELLVVEWLSGFIGK